MIPEMCLWRRLSDFFLKKEEKWLSSLFITTAIFLGSFRLPYEEIRDIVLEVDEERLSESLIQVRVSSSVVFCEFFTCTCTRTHNTNTLRAFPCAPLKINLKCGRWLIETLFRSGLFCFWHQSISPLTRGPLRPPVFISPQWLKEDRTWQSLLRLHPPFLLSLS